VKGEIMTFREYYGEPFRSDLSAVVTSNPSPHSEADEVTIQPRTLSTENSVIRVWEPERLRLFATALYYTILVDQVCYTHFGSVYSQFKVLTRYPKFRGDCPGGCYGHIHPMNILKAIGSELGPANNWSGQVILLVEAAEVMHAEVRDFFRTYLRAVDGEHFWRKCVDEM
jgi:hypothetical protein